MGRMREPVAHGTRQQLEAAGWSPEAAAVEADRLIGNQQAEIERWTRQLPPGVRQTEAQSPFLLTRRLGPGVRQPDLGPVGRGDPTGRRLWPRLGWLGLVALLAALVSLAGCVRVPALSQLQVHQDGSLTYQECELVIVNTVLVGLYGYTRECRAVHHPASPVAARQTP